MKSDKLNNLIEKINEKSNVSDIISDYISLEKKGNNYVGLCPFHPDSNPSISINNSKGIFKCFVCGVGGDGINFVKNYEGISYIDSIKKISEKLKIDWKRYISIKEKIIPKDIQDGWEINKEALNFFKYNLNNSNKNEINFYIKKRNLDKKIIDEFDIGYSGNSGELSNFLLNKNYSEDEIIKYGLGKRKKDTIIQDYFFNRLIFSIKDPDGNIIGFSGRNIIENDKYSKYLNSPETKIFSKSKILYNFHNAKIHANLMNEIIIVEGFMDVIALHKSGFKNSIATMGTSFTKYHSSLIKNVSKKIILAFDSDNAGLNTTISVGKYLLKEKFNVYVCITPQGKDFDEMLNLGKNKISETLNNKVTFLNFYKNLIFSKLSKSNNIENISILRKLLEVISYYDDSLILNAILNEISEKFNLSKDVLTSEFNKLINKELFLEEKINNVFFNSNNKSQNLNDKLKLRLLTNENALISYAIKNDEAFNFLAKKNEFEILNQNTFKIWINYKKSILNNEKIIDDNIIERINFIKKSNNEKLFGDDIEIIENIQSFKEHLERHLEHIKKYKLIYLKEKIKDEKFLEEKKDLLKFLIKNK